MTNVNQSFHNIQRVRPKKHLGQHFLKSESTAKKIADTLNYSSLCTVIEIGPGTGMLTKYILQKANRLLTFEIDKESIQYLQENFKTPLHKTDKLKIIEQDFLKADLSKYTNSSDIGIIGNFPYNISSQILFKTIENRDKIPQFSGMFQKEVAQRICAKSGNKTYGILSVLTQTFYLTEYLFTVKPTVFNPPPKVDSAVIKLTRREDFSLSCNEKLYFRIVKTAFQQRRKTIRNSLKNFNLSDKLKSETIFSLRPEQLSYQDFITLTNKIDKDAI